MTLARPLAVVALLLLASVVGLGAVGFATAHANPNSSSAVHGNVTGKTVIAYNGASYYFINASGGPAFAANGTMVGNLTYYASVTAVNLTGVSVIPSKSGFSGSTAQRTELSVGNITETVTIVVEISSVYQTANASINITYAVNVVQPYVLTLSLVSNSSSTILGFLLIVDLDGAPVGTISVPSLTAHQSYVATFQYATTGLSSGEHTFTVSLTNEHGLVTFAGGATTYSDSFYVPGPPPDYTIWYVAGAVAFFGAIFIFVTRVAARRRAPSRK
jgi:hypothetical protein